MSFINLPVFSWFEGTITNLSTVLLILQVIVNKSRANWRAMMTKIPVRIDDLEKIPQVSEDIKAMLGSDEKVFLEKEAPYCFLSRIESSYAELTIGCNLKHMVFSVT